MSDAVHVITRLTANWNRNRVLSWLLGILAVSMVAGAICVGILHLPLWSAVPVFLVTTVVGWLLIRPRKINEQQVASHLNLRYPELEESAQLVIARQNNLTALQLLQRYKTAVALQQVRRPDALNKPLKKAGILLTAAILLSSLLLFGGTLIKQTGQAPLDPAQATLKQPEQLPAGIREFQITITPPAYTNRSSRSSTEFGLSVEEGSTVTWKLQTDKPVEGIRFLFNNKEERRLKPAGNDSTEWTFSQVINRPGFYQVSLDENPSQLYQIEVVEDKPASIVISTPKQYSSFQAGQAAVTTLRARLSDDYAVSSASIMVTKASGKGEAVSFREQELGFAQVVNGQQVVDVSRVFDLNALGLQSGDELYFYIKARDSRGQESRSDMYFISMPDTEELLNMSGLTAGVDQVPEYFRSQRQIILDTEKLLRDKNSITKDSFNSRSDELGNDQKMLRLRYGKFLGEENETGGHSAGDGHDHSGEVEYGNVQALMDQIGHKHDNAEDPDFFEPAQKAQLKAVLAEMWTSELKLRTYVPHEALPFEYKALRLLKDLQQKSRAYVGKTATKMTPLRPEKRLTGDLTKIDPLTDHRNQPPETLVLKDLKRSVSLVEMLRDGSLLPPSDQQALLQAERSLSEQAVKEPGEYLAALGALRSVNRNGKADKEQVRIIQSALQKIISSKTPLPQSGTNGSALSDIYFRNLKKRN